MDSLLSKIFLAAAWFFGIAFILIAILLTIIGESITGPILLIAGFLFLPSTKKFISSKIPSLKKGVITIIATVLVFTSLFFTQDTENNEKVYLSEGGNEADVLDGEDTKVADIDEQPIPVDNEPELVVEENSYDDEYIQEIETAHTNRNKRSEFPSISLDFSVLTEQNPLKDYLTLSIVSKNKDPVFVYDIVVNDGRNCGIYSNDEGVSRDMYFGEKYQFNIFGCDIDQIIEVKIITDKGYTALDMEVYY
jgi:hypothetical protein